jgi:DNA repair protein RecN (Recombination protein N)
MDEDSLSETEERLFALRAAGRKYGRAPDELHAYADEVRRQLEVLDQGEEGFAALRVREKAAREAYLKLAKQLSDRRAKAAGSFAKAVMKELKPLKLEKARFQVSVTPLEDEAGPGGIDRVAFEVSTNPGAPFGPLRQIASGGELSRFVLALKTVLAVRDDRSVIVFDEVDSGVGGAVADAIGERLSRIAETAQTLVVTHSPQVAARAERHFKVEKTGQKTVRTQVTALSDEDRLEEIARMLSGAEVTAEARAAAKRLLEGPGKKGRAA